MSTLRLPVPLTDTDRLSLLEDLAAAQTELEKVEIEKKLANSGHNAAIKKLKASVHSLTATKNSGVIHRDVEVEARPDPDSGKTVTWRLDTNTVVKSEEMDPDERQIHIDNQIEKARAADGPPTEEQELADDPEHAEELRTQRLAADAKERATEDRLTAWLSVVMARCEVFDVLEVGEGEDKYEARAPEVFGAGVKLSATGQEPDEARAALRDLLVEMWRKDDEKRETARQERILEKVGEVWAGVTTREENGAWIANGGTDAWGMEAEGDTEGDARRNLRSKLIAKFEADEDEVARLAAEQVADAKANGPKHLLRAPRKAKKPKGISVEVNGKKLTAEELEAGGGDEPPTDGEPPTPTDDGAPADDTGLAF